MISITGALTEDGFIYSMMDDGSPNIDWDDLNSSPKNIKSKEHFTPKAYKGHHPKAYLILSESYRSKRIMVEKNKI